MKRLSIVMTLFFSLTIGLVVLEQRSAAADLDTAKVAAAQVEQPPVFNPDAEQYKKCSFRSDCRYGTCKKSRCGGCSFKSDCKGWGVCKNGWCGGCSFQSDCKGWGGCQSGRCKKGPY